MLTRIELFRFHKWLGLSFLVQTIHTEKTVVYLINSSLKDKIYLGETVIITITSTKEPSYLLHARDHGQCFTSPSVHGLSSSAPHPPPHLPAQEPRSSSQIIPSQGLSAVLASCLYFSSLRPLDKVRRDPVQTRRSSVSSPNTAVVNSGETEGFNGLLNQESADLSARGQRIGILDFAFHSVSVTTTQHCH